MVVYGVTVIRKKRVCQGWVGGGEVYDSDELIIPHRTVRFAVTKGHRS